MSSTTQVKRTVAGLESIQDALRAMPLPERGAAIADHPMGFGLVEAVLVHGSVEVTTLGERSWAVIDALGADVLPQD